jgi:hypothetical protein
LGYSGFTHVVPGQAQSRGSDCKPLQKYSLLCSKGVDSTKLFKSIEAFGADDEIAANIN